MAEPPFTVVICTRNRREHLLETLDGLRRQTYDGFDVMVVDQSPQPLGPRPGVRVLADRGRGLSRARNLAWRATDTDWLVFLDDDCLPEPDWARALRDELAAHPEAAFVSGHVGERELPDRPDAVPYATFPVERERTLSGRWVWPFEAGYGVCFGVRRDWVDRLGGWDERLGPGVPEFPASDDMDFNFRLLRAGGVVRHTPAARAHHHQWRPDHEVVALYGGYMASWCGFAVKTARTGDPLAAAWLFGHGLRVIARMLASAVRHRSRLRLRIAASRTRGMVRGTRQALTRPW